MEEEKKETKILLDNGGTVKTAVPVLPCGHEISFEHELADLMYTIVEGCQANPKLDYMATATEAIREVFAYCYLTIPSYDELIKIKLAHSMEDHSKGVQ